jgi:predicted RNA-binding protein with PIN domain
MAYLIDGHNLIAAVPDIHLDEVDDETHLIQVLQEFCRQRKKRVEVFFDNAPPGQPRTRKYGLVTAHFIRQGSTADQAIMARLRQIGRAAPNWTVVTSDREVQAAAHGARAQLISSQDFTRQLGGASPAGQSASPETDPNLEVSDDEVADWLEEFKGDPRAK